MACTPKDIYTALIKAGFSTNQAIGAMANGIAESELNAEARVVDSNGYYSNGIWQFNEASYPNAGQLVTGNCAADITAQVGLLKSSVSGQALAGSNAGQIAGNFAQYFERCSTCTPGGTSYDQRVANAATVAGWVSSGSWPTSTAGLSGAASTKAAAATGPDCAFKLGGQSIGGIFHLPDVCLLKKATIRHVVGGGLMIAGGTITGLGVILLAAFAFRASGAQRAATQIAGTYAPAGRVVTQQAQRHQATRARQARTRASETARGSREARRAAGSTRSQNRAVRGAAPRRQPPKPPPRPPRAEHHEARTGALGELRPATPPQ